MVGNSSDGESGNASEEAVLEFSTTSSPCGVLIPTYYGIPTQIFWQAIEIVTSVHVHRIEFLRIQTLIEDAIWVIKDK